MGLQIQTLRDGALQIIDVFLVQCTGVKYLTYLFSMRSSALKSSWHYLLCVLKYGPI